MLRPSILILLVGVIAGIGAATHSATRTGAEPPKTNVQVLMRDKLTHAQSVLDGLVTDDFEKIAKAADMMQIIGRAASWQAIKTNAYKTHSDRFAKTTSKLAQAAENTNRDGVLLQYLQLTTSCVECHQYIREQQRVREAPEEDFKQP